MNKEACDVFDKLPDLKMLFQKFQNVPTLYCWLYHDDSSDDLLLNETTFTTKSMAILFKTID